MNNIWTLVAVMVYLGGRLGPDGIMTGMVAETALLVAVISQAGFAIIDVWLKRHALASNPAGKGLEKS